MKCLTCGKQIREGQATTQVVNTRGKVASTVRYMHANPAKDCR